MYPRHAEHDINKNPSRLQKNTLVKSQKKWVAAVTQSIDVCWVKVLVGIFPLLQVASAMSEAGNAQVRLYLGFAGIGLVVPHQRMSFLFSIA